MPFKDLGCIDFLILLSSLKFAETSAVYFSSDSNPWLLDESVEVKKKKKKEIQILPSSHWNLW